ncbi:MAG: type-F conjugative transfer system secretin TraK [Rhodospirillales bacterium]|nr:type-F conjugative transfer system secretin TraK [Rhodospirillales bacterium]
MAAALVICGALSAPASGMEGAGATAAGTRVLVAVDHAELSAAVAASGVVRIALEGDRIARAVRGAGRFGIEHDPANGDLYLRRPDIAGDGADRAGETEAAPAAALFVGTEKGFTYRLILTPVAGGPAQVLIRNPAVSKPAVPAVLSADRRIGALVRLVRAAARREPLAGYAVHAGGAVAGTGVPGLTVIETWRGPRFTALVFEAGPSASEGAEGAADLAGTIGGLPGMGRTGGGVRLAALWLAAPGTGPSGGRLAVAAVEDAPAGYPRHMGDPR